MDSPHGAAVKAENFGLKGPRGWVFRGVDVDAAPGSLIALEGPSGSGRTCLLLALTGRMKPTEGYAEVGGHRLPKRMTAVRRSAGLGPVPGVTDLDPALTVAEQLREGALLQRRYEGPVRALLRSPRERAAATAARIDAALAEAGLDVAALPKGPRTSIRDLERLEALRLSVAIALLGRPRLLAVDDTDLKLSGAERAEAWDLLRGLAAAGTTVLAVCSEAPDGAVPLRTRRAAPEPVEPGGSTASAAPDAPSSYTDEPADTDEPTDTEAAAAPEAAAETTEAETTEAGTTEAGTTEAGTDEAGTDETGTGEEPRSGADDDAHDTAKETADAIAEARSA
ncbi:ATP-binding cassette domain-containing protein [Streptomyces sp. NPDC051211]|uniref:ATP-binding cassette domain-containing protein n=1 Tax=Streptomyces sp. NPDC051211 TaxID=3154643 RepID=UPI00344DBA06